MNFDINLSDNCNMRCKYCFEQGSARTNTITDDVIENTINLFDKVLDTGEKVELYFWGGEPFLQFDAMMKFLKYYKNNPKFYPFVYTNATLFKKHYKELEDYKDKLKIQMSYDFEPNNTKNRCLGNSKQSKKVRDIIKFAYNEGFHVNVKSTITFEDLSTNLYDTYLDFRKFQEETNGKCKRLAITPDTYYYNGSIIDFPSIEEQLKKIVIYLYKNNIQKTGFNWFDSHRAYCHSAKSGCFIDTDGGLYPCHGCSFIDAIYKKNYVFGNVKNITVDDIVKYNKNFEITLPKECSNCDNIVCFRCNAHNSFLNGYDIKKWNIKNEDIICKVYKLISKYVYSYKELVKGEKNNESN